MLILANDVETNPGPKTSIQSYNVRGLKEYPKLKRIINLAAKINKCDPGILLLHETHLDEKEAEKLDYMWCGSSVVSPGTNSARGTIMLYNENQFDKVLYKHGETNGRTTCLITEKNDTIHMFIGIYGPNKDNANFYKQLIDKAKDLIDTHSITSITLGGDLNVEIVKTVGRHAGRQEREAAD
jgi:hypothetical protein